MNNQIRVGVLGIGNMGASHAQKLLAGEGGECVLGAVCDRKEARRAWAKETLGDAVPVFESAEEMMDSGTIDAVLVALPHYDHPPSAIAALKRGLHVMIEKPAGVYTKQVLEMNEVAAQSDAKFGIMMCVRTHPVYRKMREIIQGGELGAIRRVNWIITNWYRPQAYYDSGDWRATWAGEGGGVLLNQCPHNIDLLQWICGMPTKITAHVHFGKWHNIEVEDDVTAYMEFKNGATGVLVTSTADLPGTNRFEITCEKGTIVSDGTTLTMWKSEISEPDFSAVNTKIFGKPEFEKIEVELDTDYTQHMGVMRAFAGNILRGEPMIAFGEEGINAVTIFDAMLLSEWTGNKTIDLENFDHDLYYAELTKRINSSAAKTNVKESMETDMGGSFSK